jgi:hypothetical protein
MTPTYFKTFSPIARAIDTVFPCDGDDLESTQRAYAAAVAARKELHSAPVSCWLRPSVSGPWNRCPEVAT